MPVTEPSLAVVFDWAALGTCTLAPPNRACAAVSALLLNRLCLLLCRQSLMLDPGTKQLNSSGIFELQGVDERVPISFRPAEFLGFPLHPLLGDARARVAVGGRPSLRRFQF